MFLNDLEFEFRLRYNVNESKNYSWKFKMSILDQTMPSSSSLCVVRTSMLLWGVEELVGEGDRRLGVADEDVVPGR